jgi:hypothetical protein
MENAASIDASFGSDSAILSPMALKARRSRALRLI